MTKDGVRILFLAFGALLASCGGGGGGTSALPGAPAKNGTQSAGKVVIVVPNKTASAIHRKLAISPSASSVSIGVTGISSPQVFDISATSSLCQTISGGRSCTLSIAAPPGNDTITVTVYSGPNAGGSALGTGSSTVNVVQGATFNVNITLDGIIASLKFILPNTPGAPSPTPTPTSSPSPEPGMCPPSVDCGSNGVPGEGPDAGYAQSGVGTLEAFDAGNNLIVGSYNQSVTITSSDPGTTVTPSTVSASGPLTFSYDGTNINNPIVLTATAGSVTGTYTALPVTNIQYYETPTINPSLFAQQGSDGKIYFTELGTIGSLGNGLIAGTGPGKIAQFDPVAKTFAEITVGQNPLTFAFAPDNSIFITNNLDNEQGSIGHIPAGFVASGYTTASPPVQPSRPRYLALGSDGNMWFSAQASGSVGKFNPATPNVITEYALPFTDTIGSHPTSIAAGADGNLWTPDWFNASIDQVTTAGVVTVFPIPGQTGVINTPPFNPTVELRSIAPGSDGNLYVADIGNINVIPAVGKIWKVTTSGAISMIALPSPWAAPDAIVPGPPGTMIFSDIQLGAIGELNVATGQVSEFPLLQNCGNSGPNAVPDGIAYATDGTIYFTSSNCSTLQNLNPGPGFLGHLILAPGWRAYPNQRNFLMAPTGEFSTQLIGILEGSNNGPFSGATTNPAVATIAPVTGNPLEFMVTCTGIGTGTVTITDAHGLVQTYQVISSSGSGTIQSGARRVP